MLFLARDPISEATAKEMFPSLKVLLYPDIVTSLIGAYDYTDSKRKGIYLCRRKDIEQYYTEEDYQKLREILAKFDDVEVSDTIIGASNRDIFNDLQTYVENIIQHFASFRIVITDKFHGLIFSMIAGTPCLVSALKAFLGKDYDNLITVDFVCHGVPSPGVFHSYCRHLEKKYSSPLKHVEFRVKKPSWSLSSTVYSFENGKRYRGNMLEDPYNVCFAQYNNSIRRACFQCRYATKARVSDITLCDYWGKREVQLTQDDDEYGVSAVMLNTEKGLALFDRITESLYYKKISFESIAEGNERLYSSTLHAQNAEEFWTAYTQNGADFNALKPFCRSYFAGKSIKTRFMMLHNYSFPIKLMRKIKKLLKPRH